MNFSGSLLLLDTNLDLTLLANYVNGANQTQAVKAYRVALR